MPFISFIYRIHGDLNTYYGKYVTDYISDDHEGLDLEVKSVLMGGYNLKRKKNNLSELEEADIQTGILSLSFDNYAPCFSSIDEVKCFDFYCIYSEYNYEYYVDGILIE